MRTKREQRRDADRRAIERKLARQTPPWLPMPVAGREATLSYKEWLEYRERCARHRALDPEYDHEWHRPTPETARALWAMLAHAQGLRLGAFLPRFALSPGERDDLTLLIQQALVVVLDTVVHA